MKLACKVEVINRKHCNSGNDTPRGKYLKSTLALGKEPGVEFEFFLIHFSSKNKTGERYKIKCLKQVFVKCLKDGKATLRFEEPPNDLCIKSEVVQLKCFIKLLKSCIAKDTKDLKLPDLCNISVIATDNAPTKLTITRRSDFPKKGFPRTLEQLSIVGLRMYNFRRDILTLNYLSILDLSNNEIKKIPSEFGRMPNIQELHLANNQLGCILDADWSWLLGPQITKTLKLLDISGNKLKCLTQGIWKLQNLITLKVDNNELENLPSTIGRISTLRYLTVFNNQLKTLPCSLMQCRLELIDVSSNQFQCIELSSLRRMCVPLQFYVNTLVDSASIAVLRHKIHYAPDIIPKTLVDFLDDAHTCTCGKPVVNANYYVKKRFNLKSYFKIVVYDNVRCNSVRFDCYYCSPKCFRW